jgi:hypothetical protein
VDTLLRRHGFRILERKGNLVPVWERAGQRYSQYRARKTIPADEVDAARQAQQESAATEGVCSGTAQQSGPRRRLSHRAGLMEFPVKGDATPVPIITAVR